MSTKFAVKVERDEYAYLSDDYDEIGDEEDMISDFSESTLVVHVARRSRTLSWTNAIAHLLPDDTPVIPTNNSAQGIYTIGDIKRKIKNQQT